MIDAERKRQQARSLALALVLSLWAHVLLLALFRYAPPWPSAPILPPLAVELELPPETETEKKTLDRDENQERPWTGPSTAQASPPPEEDTISLESREPKYFSYLGQVKVRIKNHWVFPRAARQERGQARLTAMLTLDRSGRLLDLTLVSSSGHPLLDHAALEAVRGGAPYPPFPGHIKLQRLNIRAIFDYRVYYLTVK